MPAMAQPRSQLVPTDTASTFHCVQRCVRRAFLCGIDEYTGQSFEHRKHWVQARIALVASCFAADVLAYAVMSNHLHIVIHMDPTHVGSWDDETVIKRWLTLFPPRNESHHAREHKRLRILQDVPYLAELRRRLGDLSWLMRCLAEPIARRANAEDRCKGRFWEGRYKCQLLCDSRAVLAAMAYVDLNPIRAGVTKRLENSDHTSVQQRIDQAKRDPVMLTQSLVPTSGSLLRCLPIRTSRHQDTRNNTNQDTQQPTRTPTIQKSPTASCSISRKIRTPIESNCCRPPKTAQGLLRGHQSRHPQTSGNHPGHPTNQKSPTASCSISRQPPIRTPTNQQSPTGTYLISRQQPLRRHPAMRTMVQMRA